jgi:N4-(beta-N-acetylglucosaminyl)-L-asparaginase
VDAARPANPHTDRYNHDTIGACALDVLGNLAGGASSNGALHKLQGRVGDVPVTGAGVYADSLVGCAAATGDGDLTQRFLPAYQAVEFMRGGMSPQAACEASVRRIMVHYNTSFHIGLVCLGADGSHGAAAQGWTFTYAIASPVTGGNVVAVSVAPLPPLPEHIQSDTENRQELLRRRRALFAQTLDDQIPSD